MQEQEKTRKAALALSPFEKLYHTHGCTFPSIFLFKQTYTVETSKLEQIGWVNRRSKG